jgi:carboxyl-terminal processing protease
MWIGFRLRKNIPETQSFFSGNKRSSLQEVMNLIRTKYVDSVNTDTLTEDAIQAMLSKLDPHTIYIPAVYTTEANEDLKGNFEGIGVEYLIIEDTIHATNVLEDGPSDKAGVQTGDKFIKVGDSLVAGTVSATIVLRNCFVEKVVLR